uniref:Peptidase n=1 Tax=Toxocara canis TaxID=6265 RepID=A0A183U682_TOXCA
LATTNAEAALRTSPSTGGRNPADIVRLGLYEEVAAAQSTDGSLDGRLSTRTVIKAERGVFTNWCMVAAVSTNMQSREELKIGTSSQPIWFERRPQLSMVDLTVKQQGLS